MRSNGPRTTFLGKLVILAFVGACAWGAYQLFLKRGGKPPLLLESPKTVLRIACSEETHAWLDDAAGAFGRSNDVNVEILPLDAPNPNVWLPASSLAKDQAATPLLNEKSIGTTRLVFVMWKERLPAFKAKYGEVSLESVAHALAEPRGWEAAGHPEWGLFKFAIEDRDAVLALLACGEKNILDVASKPALKSLARNATVAPMRGGPEAFDGGLVYERSALADGLQVIEPSRNFVADHPYYILDAPWSTPDQRNAAQAFLDDLLSGSSQQGAQAHGFNRQAAGTTCPPPPPAAMANLRAAWQRVR